MKFTLDSRNDINLIRGYGPGEVRIGEQVLHAPCIVMADRLIADWTARDVTTLSVADLAPIFELQPDLVLLGTGPKQTFPASTVRAAFAERKVGLEVMDLGAACRTFNILVQEERRVAAALFCDLRAGR
jgi:uncharacterized protein